MDSGILFEQPLRQLKAQVKLDKGFAEGTYAAYLEYDGLADDKGFGPARKAARDFALLLREQLGTAAGCAVGKLEDHSRSGDTRRKRDLECTFLSIPIEYADGRWHDAEVQERFRVALLRAGQAWEQAQAGVQARRRTSRQEQFRQRLDTLLEGEAYTSLDLAAKRRLIEEVTEMVFPPKSVDLT
jgi:hypothetical protein